MLLTPAEKINQQVGNQEAMDVVLRSAFTGKKHAPAEDHNKENTDEIVCINSSSSPKIKRVSVFKQRKMTSLSPSHYKKTTASSNLRGDTENESPPSKMRRTPLFHQSIKTQPPSKDSTQSASKGLVSACKELANLALTRGSLDDVTVMVIDLNHFRVH